jgi:hypothetical protein
MGEESAFRVLSADDHPLMVGGLRQAVLAAASDAESQDEPKHCSRLKNQEHVGPE